MSIILQPFNHSGKIYQLFVDIKIPKFPKPVSLGEFAIFLINGGKTKK